MQLLLQQQHRQPCAANRILWTVVALLSVPSLSASAFAPPTGTHRPPSCSSKAPTTALFGWLDQLQDLATKTKATTAAPFQQQRRPKVSLPKDFFLPEPKPLSLTRSENVPDALKSSLALAVRLGTGAFVLGWKIDTLFAPDDDGKYALPLGPFRIRDSSSVLDDAPRPAAAKPLILYEYDASPYCKRVREMINLLDLTVEYRPCPGARDGSFSDELFRRTGRRTVPYLIDENTGMEMFESSDIIEYLLQTYGPQDETSFDRKALWPITFESFSIITSSLVAAIRAMPGATRQPDARPDNEQMLPLELWGYECSPFVRPVREKLGSLCLPHRMVSCSRGSANRDKMIERTGCFQVPFLVDPNTGIEMFESAEIVEYLDQVYTVQ
jgi:glutathione S-transferase